jgi:hypothetical protein
VTNGLCLRGIDAGKKFQISLSIFNTELFVQRVYDALLFLSWKFTRTDAAGVGIPRGKRALYATCHALFFAAENYYEKSLIKLQKFFEESIVNAPPNYNSDQLFKSNLTFCVVVHSQLTLRRRI